MPEQLRMNAYYYAFTATGVDEVDRILSAVAWAGKAAHHTDEWGDDQGGYGPTGKGSPVEWIQEAADSAAAAIRKARGEA